MPSIKGMRLLKKHVFPRLSVNKCSGLCVDEVVGPTAMHWLRSVGRLRWSLVKYTSKCVHGSTHGAMCQASNQVRVGKVCV